MAKPAEQLRDQAQIKWPGAEVHARRRSSIVHRHPDEPKRRMLDTTIGAIHYGENENLEIDTEWLPSEGEFQWAMEKADYNAFAKNDISSGDGIKYVDPYTDAYIIFQPESIRYRNQDGSEQYIGGVQSVLAQKTDDVLYWANAMGSGRHFQWTAQTTRLQKLFIVDTLSALPPVEPWLTGEIDLQVAFYMKYEGVSIWVNGVEWNEEGEISTQGLVEFKNAEGKVLWWLDYPRVWDSGEDNHILGTFNIIKQSNDIYIRVRVPKTWINQAQFPIYIDPTIDAQVAANADDCHWGSEGNNAFNLGSQLGYIYDGHASEWLYGITPLHQFCAWRDLPDLDGATVDSAHVDVRSQFSIHSHLLIRCYAVDDGNVTSPTTAAQGEALSLTTAFADWDIGTTYWTGGTFYPTPSLVSIIQELIDTHGGDLVTIAVVLRDNGSGEPRHIGDYSNDPLYAPKLHIEYTTAGLQILSTTTSEELTHSHDSVLGDNRLLVVRVGYHNSTDQTATIDDVTYNGVSLTRIVGAVHLFGITHILRSEYWVLASPATGANNIVVSVSAAPDRIGVVATTWIDAKGVGANTDTIVGNIDTISLGFTTEEATSQIDGFWQGQGERTITPGVGVTEIGNVTPGTNPSSWAGKKDATGGADTWEITLVSSVRSTAAAIEIQEILELGAPPQYARPNADISIGGWTNQDNQIVGLYQSIDEAIPSDLDYIKSANNPVDDTVVIGLESKPPPTVNTGHIFRYRHRKGGEGAEVVNITVDLMQGDTVIASWEHTNIGTVVTAEQTLTEIQAGNITDYSNLRFRVTASRL